MCADEGKEEDYGRSTTCPSSRTQMQTTEPNPESRRVVGTHDACLLRKRSSGANPDNAQAFFKNSCCEAMM